MSNETTLGELKTGDKFRFGDTGSRWKVLGHDGGFTAITCGRGRNVAYESRPSSAKVTREPTALKLPPSKNRPLSDDLPGSY